MRSEPSAGRTGRQLGVKESETKGSVLGAGGGSVPGEGAVPLPDVARKMPTSAWSGCIPGRTQCRVPRTCSRARRRHPPSHSSFFSFWGARPRSAGSLRPDARGGARTCLGFLLGTRGRDVQGAAHGPTISHFPRLAPRWLEVPHIPDGGGSFLRYQPAHRARILSSIFTWGN